MSNRAKDLAERFELANAEFAAFMQEIPEAQWRRILGEGELRSVATFIGGQCGWLTRRCATYRWRSSPLHLRVRRAILAYG
jgi:hypothetical protein